MFMPDLDRLANTFRYVVMVWVAWLAMIYVEGLPGGIHFAAVAGTTGMTIVKMPQLPISLLYAPAAASVLFAGILYLLIMPQLSSYMALGLMIFAATFIICYLYYKPQQIIGRVLGLCMFVVIAAITNEQTYNFLDFASYTLLFPMLFLLYIISAYIPFSPRPELVVLRLLSRFFRSGEYLMSTMHWPPERSPTYFHRWRKAFHERELNTLPAKLGIWVPHISARVLPGNSAGKVHTLMASLQVLSYRMQQLLEACSDPQAQYLVQQLLEDFKTWSLRVQETFQQLSKDPAAGQHDVYRSGLDKIMDKMETRIMDVMNKAADGQLSDQEAENFYRLLDAYRGVSKTLVDFIGDTDDIDWPHWREERLA